MTALLGAALTSFGNFSTALTENEDFLGSVLANWTQIQRQLPTLSAIQAASLSNFINAQS
jgi:hypothetical protein